MSNTYFTGIQHAVSHLCQTRKHIVNFGVSVDFPSIMVSVTHVAKDILPPHPAATSANLFFFGLTQVPTLYAIN